VPGSHQASGRLMIAGIFGAFELQPNNIIAAARAARKTHAHALVLK